MEDARGRCDGQALAALWEQVPTSMRLTRLAESTVPARYAGGFCQEATWRAGIELSGLPESMRQELLWCVFRIIEMGQKATTLTLSMLVRRLGEVVADHDRGVLSSLLAMSVQQWCRHFQHAVHRRTSRVPAAATITQIRHLLTRMMRLLVTGLRHPPWWQRDRWDPVEEPRFPLCEHEPMGGTRSGSIRSTRRGCAAGFNGTARSGLTPAC